MIKNYELLTARTAVFDTHPQKPRCHGCKQTIHHSTTTVPSTEIPTFDGIADQRRI